MEAGQPSQTDADTRADSGSQKRERSTVEFPYMALNDAIYVTRGIHETTGSSACQHDQLAAKLGLSMNSSGYRMRISTARMFGLVESDRGGGVKLTPLGQTIVDSSRQREAKAKAFLKVPLYQRLYEHYRGKVLPPGAALERKMANLGVAQKQTDRARQAFERSAETAGFFEMGRDRLVPPGGIAEAHPPKPDEQLVGAVSERGDEQRPRHPLVEGLFQSLPWEQEGWTLEEAADWLQAAAFNFRLIYKLKGTIKVEIVPPRQHGSEMDLGASIGPQ